MLALPGSAYLYQGEELGLHEVSDLPARAAGPDLAADAEHQEGPRRLPGAAALDRRGRLVRLRRRSVLAARSRPGFSAYGGRGAGRAAGVDPGALPGRAAGTPPAADRRGAGPGCRPNDPQVLHFVRPGGWHCMTNFGTEPVALPEGVVRVSSVPLTGGHAAGRDHRVAHGVAAATRRRSGFGEHDLTVSEPAHYCVAHALFGRKKTDAPAALAGQLPEPLPPPPEPDRNGLRSMEAHREYLLSCVERAAAVPPAPAGRARPEPVRGDRRRRQPAAVRQLGDGRVRGAGGRRGRRRRRTAPVSLPVVGEIAAGSAAPHRLSPGTAMKIMTGAPVPEQADAIVPYENTDRGDQRRQDHRAERGRTSTSAASARTSRPASSCSARAIVLGSRDIGVLAGIGRDKVLVRPRPRVVVISTGSELVEPGLTLEQRRSRSTTPTPTCWPPPPRRREPRCSGSGRSAMTPSCSSRWSTSSCSAPT